MNMDDIRELLQIIGCILVVFFMAFALVFVPVLFIKKEQCSKYSEITKRETKWYLFGGCYVNAENEWYTMGEYESSITAKNTLQLQE